MRTVCDGMQCIFHAHPRYGGNPWYDWAYVEFAEDDVSGSLIKKYYPSLILGFIQFMDEADLQAVVRTSIRDLPWDTRKSNFISSFLLSTNFEENYILVPVSSIVHPMFAFQDYGGVDNKFFTSIPKRNWAAYFDDKIVIAPERIDVEDSDEDGAYDQHGDVLLDVDTSDEDDEDSDSDREDE